MSDIYGKLTEHPEVPIEDPEHFTITIKVHDYEQAPQKRGERYQDQFCARCGYHKDTGVHRRTA